METNFKPILFSTPMVQAIIRGQKTQTRRIIRHKNKIEEIYPVIRCSGNEKDWGKYILRDEFGEDFLIKPKYQVGDILWVRETFAVHFNSVQGSYSLAIKEEAKYPPHFLDEHGVKRCIDFKADYPKSSLKWKPSIFMPKEACRLFLKLTKIQVDRLDNITREDAIAEGVESWYEKYHFCQRFKDYTGVTNGFFDESNPVGCSAPEASFRSLWAKINGFDSLNANPFVWVYEFELSDCSGFRKVTPTQILQEFRIKPDLKSIAQS